MKYIFLLLLFPLFVTSEEENSVTTNEIESTMLSNQENAFSY